MNSPSDAHTLALNILNQLSQLNPNAEISKIQQNLTDLIGLIKQQSTHCTQLGAQLSQAQEILLQNDEEINIINESCK